MSEPMPQAFADALCNDRAENLYRATLADELNEELRRIHKWHQRGRYRGMEGTNGVACDECKIRAVRIWADYQRILDNLAKRERS